ncbi:MAG: hypothetical protein JWQ96_404 [Segetibacter sp.]|nr:hypothetical protein [Segetibacter sp.]
MMNRRVLFVNVSLVLLVFSLLLQACFTAKKTTAKKYSITITNPSSIERADELIVLTRDVVEQKTGKLKEDVFINLTDKNNQQVILQFDDLDKNGQWDEAAFLYRLKPDETVQLNVTPTTARLNKAVVRAHVRMSKKNDDNSFGLSLDSVTIPKGTPPTDFTKQKLPPYLTEGPAWENDKVAFRLYMDTRNTKDIYGKTTQKMMMDSVGVNPANSYHKLADWGMDILAVGKSLGAGSIALKLNIDNGKDTLVRLGGMNVEETTYEKIADGPVRAIFRMHYKNWTVLSGLPPVNIIEEISIWGGKYFYQGKVTVSNTPPGAQLVTGIVNLKSKKSTELNIDGCKAIYTYDVQSENNDKLGMGILVRSNHFAAFGKTPNTASEVLNTYTVTMPLTTQPTEFRFYAGWELSDLLFIKEESFKMYLEYEAMKYAKPVIVSFQ